LAILQVNDDAIWRHTMITPAQGSLVLLTLLTLRLALPAAALLLLGGWLAARRAR
jgi:hypothetical protein